MSQVLSIDHEDGTLSEWTGVNGDGIVTTSAAMNGTTYGLGLGSNGAYARIGSIPSWVPGGGTDQHRLRFYVNLSSINLFFTSQTNQFLLTNQNNPTYNIIRTDVQRTAAGTKGIVAYTRGASGDITISNMVTVTTAHYFEVRVIRASSSTASDGQANLYFDGSAVATVTGIDNYNYISSLTHMSLEQNMVATGYAYYDQIIYRDDDTPIGTTNATGYPPFPPAPPPSSSVGGGGFHILISDGRL